MLKRLRRNKKAQQTAEYALLISLVVAAVIAMQTYAQRTIQARIRDASGYLATETSALGGTNQYEPYYLETSYDIYRDNIRTEIQDNDTVGLDTFTNRSRGSGGYQVQKYDTSLGLSNGI
jgi:Flp pilus assembly pilin Flp